MILSLWVFIDINKWKRCHHLSCCYHLIHHFHFSCLSCFCLFQWIFMIGYILSCLCSLLIFRLFFMFLWNLLFSCIVLHFLLFLLLIFISLLFDIWSRIWIDVVFKRIVYLLSCCLMMTRCIFNFFSILVSHFY